LFHVKHMFFDHFSPIFTPVFRSLSSQFSSLVADSTISPVFLPIFCPFWIVFSRLISHFSLATCLIYALHPPPRHSITHIYPELHVLFVCFRSVFDCFRVVLDRVLHFHSFECWTIWCFERFWAVLRRFGLFFTHLFIFEFYLRLAPF
jgi:hypothetical protein